MGNIRDLLAPKMMYKPHESSTRWYLNLSCSGEISDGKYSFFLLFILVVLRKPGISLFGGNLIPSTSGLTKIILRWQSQLHLCCLPRFL